jgi:hypothetical protein
LVSNEEFNQGGHHPFYQGWQNDTLSIPSEWILQKRSTHSKLKLRAY